MSKTVSGAKKIGKLMTAVVILLLIAVFSVSKFIGGQNTAAEKYCAAIATGNYKEFVKTVPSDNEYTAKGEDYFKESCSKGIRQLPQFSELTATDNISAKVKITEHRMNGSLTEWICLADIDFFSSGKSVSYNDVRLTMKFSGGKWIITKTEPSIF